MNENENQFLIDLCNEAIRTFVSEKNREAIHMEESFLSSIMEKPADRVNKLAYADWLLEQGRDAEAAAWVWMVKNNRFPQSSYSMVDAHDGYARNGLFKYRFRWSFKKGPKPRHLHRIYKQLWLVLHRDSILFRERFYRDGPDIWYRTLEDAVGHLAKALDEIRKEVA